MNIIKTKNIFSKLFFVNLILLVFFVFASQTKAAVLFVDPEDKDREPGDIFSVTLMIESTDRPINSISAIFDFPSNLMEVVSVSKKGSIIDLWKDGPSFSNRYGTVTLKGEVLSPGFKGVAGEVLTIKFKANKEGEVVLKYLEPEILINGEDDSALEQTYPARFTIKIDEELPVGGDDEDIELLDEEGKVLGEEESNEEEIEAISDKLISPIDVRSTTHPDSGKWYNSDKVDIYWEMPDSAEEVRVLANMQASSTPKIHYDYRIASKTLEDVSDGEWYFHIQFKDDIGWGSISKFKFNVDTKSPVDLEILKATTSGEFLVSASDELSGIDHYEIQIDDSTSTLIWDGGDSGILKLYGLSAGEHTVYAKVFDRASNTAETELAFSIDEDIPQKFVEENSGEVKAEEEIDQKNSVTNRLKEFRFERFELGAWQMLSIILIAISLILFIYILIVKSKLNHFRKSAFSKIKTAEDVLNNLYSTAYDLVDSLEEAKKKKRGRLTVQEAKVLDALKKDLDEVEKEYK